MTSERHGVAAKVIATVDDLDAIAADDDADVPALKGWRRELFGEKALALKHGRLALRSREAAWSRATNRSRRDRPAHPFAELIQRKSPRLARLACTSKAPDNAPCDDDSYRGQIVGRVVLASKITHVPSLMLSEQPGPLFGTRAGPIASLKEIGRRARERGADTFLVFDTHWLVQFRHAPQRQRPPQGHLYQPRGAALIQNLAYDLPGNPELADLIAAEAHNDELDVLCAQGADVAARIRHHRSDALHERRCAR